MADSQNAGRPVTAAKRNSFLRHVQIHIELLQDSLAGDEFGCGLAQADWDKIEKRLLEIWDTALAAELAVIEPRPAVDVTSLQSAQVLPFRPRAVR
jgi:hypothetical protein